QTKRYFRKMVIIFATQPFYTEFVQQPTSQDPIPSQICNNPKYFPYFKDSIGALDGSHIHSAPAALDRPLHRNRKGFISQNCLFACNFNMEFVYSLTGAEGSANDARVFEIALGVDLHIPPNKYYLADAGYPASSQLLTPYRSVQYHLAEWGRAQQR